MDLGRNEEFLNLNYQFAFDVMKKSHLINLCPAIFKPIVGRLVSNVHQNIKRTISYVGPLMRHQLEQEELHGNDWPDRPVIDS